MITYEYRCTACSHEWQTKQKISEEAITICPACSKETAKRLISGRNGFILRGGGWAADNYSSSK